MLELREVERIVKKSAAETLKGVEIRDVQGEPTIDSIGSEALQIHVVASADADISLLSEQALRFIVSVQQALLQAGEERFPIVGFAREGECDQDDDAET